MMTDVPQSMTRAAAAALDRHATGGLNARMGSRLWVEFAHEDASVVLRAMADYLDRCTDTPAAISLDLTDHPSTEPDSGVTHYDEVEWTGTLYVDVEKH
ncbi:hypothetical protein [Streptomyces cavernicola]|uniref:Uncharacterized protein n=1 Tax=Streptomyces cavernicola TaxID=3043613 RepID=A0ABT6SAF8_9ACTN|nr:hypothetical protein [Streptomyces sp. B-S-A6]MDI3405167.1 hypothetical protein [Streptomyces sp. B-S-A6]